MASVRSRFICTVWMPLCFLSAMNTQICSEFNQTETITDHQIHQGMSTNISCDYRKNRSQYLTASLRTKQELCNYYYVNGSWIKRFCHKNITLIWIPETEEISFHLVHLQINNSGVYTCTVEAHIPPPVKFLGKTRICVHVKATPSVHVACVNRTDGAPMVLCISQGFYPDDLKQAWLRDGEYITYSNTSHKPLYKENLNFSEVNWNSSRNTDGTYSLTSYLQLSSNVTVDSCWVNHSTLSQPIIVNVSSTACTKREERLSDVLPSVTGIICGVIAGIGLITAGCYKCFRRRTCLLSSVEPSPLPETVSHSTLGGLENHQPGPQGHSTLGNRRLGPRVYSVLRNPQPDLQVYSTLGNHKPVPCRNNSNDSTSPSL